ncbi:LRR receptor-like serine/threonine-protein kinase GSO2 [Cryptomeria japonica]|uniref:LRR receptor-like serine/threonine-protein kinase GSO2 n=1 Tax=Cryptomeria japonica TaxID=3369 RepID=UPI0027DA0986|nr:LRR receptor-like serine/threonine-protein kinase GSO2 [Cryptomeria japonica]
MAIPSHKLFLVFMSLLLVFLFLSPRSSFSHPLLSTSCLSHESQALLRFKDALNISLTSSWFNLTSWVNGTDCCTNWTGISCDNHTNHVVSLDITYLFAEGVISESLCQLRFLTSLTVREISLTSGTVFPPCLRNLSYIRYLDLSRNNFTGMIPPFVCSLTRLTYLDLSWNNFNGSIPSCLGNLSSLTELDLSDNQLSGSIPASLGSLFSLTKLHLSYNQLSGSIPASLGSLFSLTKLHLSYNQLSGSIPASLGSLSLLRSLYLSNNELRGNIPDSLGNLSLLQVLDGVSNRFNETISSSSLPPSLVALRLSLNHHQLISETFFHKLTRLSSLYLSDCVLNISTIWIPSFQLYELSLMSCTIDGEFPPWISTQFSLENLKLTNASLVGVIPSWLWETSPQLQYLNLSGNHLEGSLSSNHSICTQLSELDVSRNGLSGCIPSIWPSSISILLLNDNLFSGKIPLSLGKLSQLKMLNLAYNLFSGNIPYSLGKLFQLQFLNLANNKISGMIPASLSNCSSLIVLNLGNNSLKGSLPYEFSRLTQLKSLVVHGNILNGSFPLSISNCSFLQVLDIGNNFFGGEMPPTIGNFYFLRVLVMKKNNFTGNIPSAIGHLIYLQILLLSSNHFSGLIPHTIVSLQAMTIEDQDGIVLSNFYYRQIYRDGLDMTSKGRDEHYTYILSTLTAMDLSNNELEGGIPFDFGNLKGLRFLNLSMNNLNGTIPSSLGEMGQLESLDLSRNNFFGKIPMEFISLNSLGFLKLSNNHLSGSIPQGTQMSTFAESSYSGNPNLWGCPLPKNCSWPQYIPRPPEVSINKEKKSTKYPLYGIALGLSYGVAFGGIVSLILIKMSWKRKYFNKVDAILKIVFPWMKDLTL